MFISRKKHEAEMAAKDATIARLDHKARTSGRLSAELLVERDAARAELAPLKAAKERQLQNLRDANARRSTKAGLPACAAEEV